jgi:hypothetical protein
MREITEALERNAQEVRYGSVGVELRIHDGRVVKAIYKTAKTNIERPARDRKDPEPGLVDVLAGRRGQKEAQE